MTFPNVAHLSRVLCIFKRLHTACSGNRNILGFISSQFFIMARYSCIFWVALCLPFTPDAIVAKSCILSQETKLFNSILLNMLQKLGVLISCSLGCHQSLNLTN